MGEGLATLAWLDFASWDRERALDIIAQLREKETRDELGIGTIRDAFSDRLFPGTSTLQTRARYFLFVPWIYRDLEGRKTASSDFATKARRVELRLSEELLAAGEVAGVIGRVAGRQLKRLPSSIYWLGLEAWGIKVDGRSQSDYHRAIDRWYASRGDAERLMKGDEGEQRRLGNWDSRVPAAPEGFPADVTFDLTEEEANYLHDKVGGRHPDSLLFRMLNHESGVADAGTPWDWDGLSDAPAKLRELMDHARNFSVVMEGAASLYNLMLAEIAEATRANTDSYRKLVSSWGERLSEHRSDLAQWDLAAFRRQLDQMELAPGGTARQFVDQWIQIALNQTADQIAESKSARALIQQRELRLKGGLARLRGGRPLDMWRGSSGLGALAYRWHRVSQIVIDIRLGLGKEP